VNNHALIDGNKRLGWVACAVFLDVNGMDPTAATNDEVFDLVMRVASDPIDVGELARQLRVILELRDR
jgi:death-on-curing protein